MKEFLSLIKKWMTRLLAGIATVLLSIMTLLVLYQVFTRYIFPCYGMLCMPGCSFLSWLYLSGCWDVKQRKYGTWSFYVTRRN